MGTSKTEILQWLEDAKKKGATHVIVVCDTFDHSDYPVLVMPGEDVKLAHSVYDGKNMQRVMEVYALHLDIETQLAEHRAFHFEYPPPSSDGKGCEPVGSVGPSTHGEPSLPSQVLPNEVQHEGTAGRGRPSSSSYSRVDGAIAMPSSLFLSVLECGGAPAIECSCGRTNLSDDGVAGIELGGRMFVIGCPCEELAWLERLIWSFQVPFVKYIRERRADEIADIEGLHDDE